MDLQITLPAKRVIDVHPLKVDFAPLLASGETITDVEVFVSMFTGEDPTPEDILYLAPEVLGGVVHQRIRAGIPGNIYTVIIEVTTSLANRFTGAAFQAVLPDGVPANDIFIPLILTTTPYPINVVEALQVSSLNLRNGYLVGPITEGADVVLSLQSGTLISILVTYSMRPEGVDSTFDLLSGVLTGLSVTYSGKPEGIASTFDISAGAIVNLLIIYSNYRPEGVDTSFGLVSGTLV